MASVWVVERKREDSTKWEAWSPCLTRQEAEKELASYEGYLGSFYSWRISEYVRREG